MNTIPLSMPKFWNKNFILIILSNVFLYIGVYMLFPVLHSSITEICGFEADKLSFVSMGLFGISMFLPGMFSNYLVDTFPRKKVCTVSILLFALSGIAYLYVGSLWMLCLLRIIQGALFGVVLMITGSTLVIDVTPSKCRSKANMVFAASGAAGAVVGAFFGAYVEPHYSLEYLIYISVSLNVFSFLLVSMVHVCFRAPLQVPLLSFDRFMLLGNILPGINMITIPFILGTLIGYEKDSFFYLCIVIGFFVFLLIPNGLIKKADSRLMLVLGYAMLLVSIYFLYTKTIIYGTYISGIMAGVGIPLAMYQFLYAMIQLPKHCERGTGYSTYQLMWDAGIIIGGCLCLAYDYEQLPVASLLCFIGMVIYITLTYPYLLRKQKERNS